MKQGRQIHVVAENLKSVSDDVSKLSNPLPHSLQLSATTPSLVNSQGASFHILFAGYDAGTDKISLCDVKKTALELININNGSQCITYLTNLLDTSIEEHDYISRNTRWRTNMNALFKGCLVEQQFQQCSDQEHN